MGLDNMQGGDKVFAFETNNIVKAIRTLFGLLTNKWRFISKQTITSGTFTVPKRANFIVIAISLVGTSTTIKGEIFLSRNGKMTGSFMGETNSADKTGHSFTWSGDTITLASIGTVLTSYSHTAYYYQ